MKLSKLVQSSDSRFTPDGVIKKNQFGQLIQLLMSVKIISDVVGDLLE